MIQSPQPAQVRHDLPDVPFWLMRPERLRHPVVIALPHSGRTYPQELVAASQLDTRSLRLSEDMAVDHLLTPAAQHGIPVLLAPYARAYVDLNRQASELDPAMFAPRLAGDGLSVSRRVQAGLGVLPRVVARGVDIYGASTLPADIVKERLQRAYFPYHAALKSLLDESVAQFGYAILLDGHSMPSPDVGEYGGMDARWADVVLGDNWGNSAGRGVTSALESLFIQQGFYARRNVPYSGGYVTLAYGRPARGVHAVQIELSRHLYMDEENFTLTEGFVSLQTKLLSIINEFLALQQDMAPLLRTDSAAQAAE